MAKIMLVEDDNNLREIYAARLLAEGYEIVSAADGEEALAVAVKERPDLIISDVMMPKISGFDMLDILRTTPETKDVKVIMMTALSQAEDKGRADKLGADRYLVKSQVTLEDVAKVAREVLGGETAAAPAASPAPVTTPTLPPAADTPAPAMTLDPAPEPTAPTPIPVTAPADDTPPTDPVISMPPTTPTADDATVDDTAADDSLPAPVETPPDGPVNVASAKASKVAEEVNQILTAPEAPSEPTTNSNSGTGHGMMLEPLGEASSAPTSPTPTAEPAAVPTPAPEPEADTPPPQPGNVIQPGQGPTQATL